MKTTSRCREYREGVLTRRRTYKCRVCGNKFQEDRRTPLPVKDRFCPDCKKLKHQAEAAKLPVNDWSSYEYILGRSFKYHNSIDASVVAEMKSKCPICGRLLIYTGRKTPGPYRAFAVCEDCHYAEEF